MNWYKKATLKIAKHVSETSHTCLYCDSILSPVGFERNGRHHFPWGITYKCTCGKSGVWTNSIRGPKEFMDVVFGNVPPENDTSWEGFCNDPFCPFCFQYIMVLKNGVYMTVDKKPVAIVGKDNKWFLHEITNLDLYLAEYNQGTESSRSYNAKFMGKRVNRDTVSRSVDVYGCRSLKHNMGILKNSSLEYGEGEYKPIYEWIIKNKAKIPTAMIDELKSEI